MDITINIEVLNGYYHAQDVIVRAGDVLKVKNNVPGIEFLIAIVNKDQLISGENLISETVASGITKLIGNVNSGPSLIREYSIYPTSSSIAPNPGVEAPPRIIRVS